MISDHDQFLEPEPERDEHFWLHALAGLVDDADAERPGVGILDEKALHICNHWAEEESHGLIRKLIVNLGGTERTRGYVPLQNPI